MYGLPADFDGAFLVGRTLEQVCFGLYQVALQFDQQVSITIEGRFSHQRPSESSERVVAFPLEQSDLMQLLGQSISKVNATPDGTLALVFDKGHTLYCYETPEYESYQINSGGKIIIV